MTTSDPVTQTTRQNSPIKVRNLQPASDDLDVKRDEVITLRLSPEERQAWQTAADADARKLGDWIRVVVNAALAEKTKSTKGRR